MWKPGSRFVCFMLSAMLLIALMGLQPLTANAETLTVTKPNGGETLIVGSTYTAEWSGFTGAKIHVYISVTEAYQYYLGFSTTNKHTFTVPNHLTTQAKLQIIGLDVGEDVSDNVFTIKSNLPIQPLDPQLPIQPIDPLPVFPIFPVNVSPAAPTNLTVPSASTNSIDLAWTDNASNETAFEIERRVEGGTFQKIGEVPADTVTFTDSNLVQHTDYVYRVRAVNSYGNSDYTNTVTATPIVLIGIPGPLPVPLTAQPLSATEIQLSWQDTTMGNDVFHIERNGTEIATMMDSAETYRDTGLQPETTYTYRLRLDNPPSDPIYTPEVSAKTLAAAMLPPVVPVEPPLVQGGEAIVLYFDINSTDYYINGILYTMDAPPVIYEGRTVLPIKYVAGPLGAVVNWDPGPSRVRITHQNRVVDLWIGQNRAEVNGNREMIDPNNDKVTPVVMPPGRTMLPLKFIAVQLGAQVDWDPVARRVTITYRASQS